MCVPVQPPAGFCLKGGPLRGRGGKAPESCLLSLLSRNGEEASEASSESHCMGIPDGGMGVPLMLPWASP